MGQFSDSARLEYRYHNMSKVSFLTEDKGIYWTSLSPGHPLEAMRSHISS